MAKHKRLQEKRKKAAPVREHARFDALCRWGYQRRWLWLSFLIPFGLMGIVFAAYGVYPFGTKQVLVTDLWHQYYPFLCMLQEKLKSGGSLLYSWTSGLGTNFLAMLAYYTGSPLNLLTVFVPAALLREAVAVLVMAKLGFAGLFCALFLSKGLRREGGAVCLFAVLYALCDYMMGYYWNIIWLDTVALLPLVMLGLVYLIRDGKWKLYAVALALSLIANYYIALFTCIFSVLVFGVICLCTRLPIRKLPLRAVQFGGASLLGGGLSAWLLLPAYRALQLTYSANNRFPDTIKWYESWRDLLGAFLGFHEPTAKEGLPNVYCGMLCVVLFFAFLLARNIRVCEKVSACLLIGFLTVSCNLNVLNYLWHGCHFTNMLLYRFSFLISFVLVAAAFRAFTKLREDFWLPQGIAMVVGVAALGACTYGTISRGAWIGSLLIAGAYLTLLWIGCKKPAQQGRIRSVLCLLVGLELCFQVHTGLEAVTVTTRSVYPKNAEAVERVRDQVEAADPSFYRMETTKWYTLNDNALYNFHGVSQFSSMANVSVTTCLKHLGLPGGENANRYYYTATTPLNNMLLGIKYVVDHDGNLADASLYTEAASEASVKAYQFRYALPLGYVVPSELGQYALGGSDYFVAQNRLFTAMTGLTGDLFVRVDPTAEAHEDLEVSKTAQGVYQLRNTLSGGTALLSFSFAPETAGEYYGYVSCSAIDEVTVLCDEMDPHSYEIKKRPYLFPMGKCEPGQTLTLMGKVKAGANQGATMYVYRLNEELLAQGQEILAGGGMQDLSVTDTQVTGTVTTEQAALLYTSIPEDGGWSALVDGEPAEVKKVLGAFVGVSVPAGTHTVTLSYCPDGFAVGAGISGAAVLVFAALWFVGAKRAKKKEEGETSDSCEISR